MQKLKVFFRFITLFLLFNLLILGQTHADIIQPYSNTFLSINYYDLGQSFTAESDKYSNIYAWVDPSFGSGDVGITLKLNSTPLASGTSSVAADGMISLNVSGANFVNGTSYDFYLSGNYFAKVYWEDYGTMGDVYTGGQLITSFGYVEAPPFATPEALSEYDLAFTVSTAAVPIPGSMWLLGVGLLGFAGLRRKQKG